MVTTRLYSCNLCRHSISEYGFNGRGRGVGIYFVSCADGDKIDIKHIRDAENHVCGECIDALFVALAALKTVGDV